VKEVFWQMLGDLKGALHYEYDDLSRRTRVWMDYTDVPETWHSTDFDNRYQYDAQSRMTRVTQSVHPENSGYPVPEKRVDLAYNALDEFVSITRYSDLDGLPSQEVFTSTYQYDGLGRLASLVHQKTGQPAINSYTFAYDVINRLTSMNSKDGPSTFTYDSTSQLTSANHTNGAGLPADESYVHDLNGNRVSATAGSSSSAYATGTNNQLLSDGTYSYSYDLEGNRTGRTRISDGQFTEYRYDHHNQLVFVGTKTSASAPTYTSRVQMVYDLFGRRFQKLVDSDGDGDWDSQSGYVSDGMHVALEYKGSSLADAEFVRRYLHGPAVDQVLVQEEIINFSTLTYWMAPDHLGTIRDMTNGSGTAILHATFGAFGQLVHVDNPEGVPYPFGFTGREWDAETGLWYYRARYYDANTGRFLSEDPLGFAAGDTNLSRYVGNGPTNWVDPEGMQRRRSQIRNYEEMLERARRTGNRELERVALYFLYGEQGLHPEHDLMERFLDQPPLTNLPAVMSWMFKQPQDKLLKVLGTIRHELTDAVGHLCDHNERFHSPFLYERKHGIGSMDSSYDPEQDPDRWKYEFVIDFGTDPLTYLGAAQLKLIRPGTKLGSGLPIFDDSMRYADEYLRFRTQGFTTVQSHYLSQPYTGVGHHAPISQSRARSLFLPNRIRDSSFNVLRPIDLNRGRFYELHFCVDSNFFTANFPKSMGGTWDGSKLGFTKHGPWGRQWYGTPRRTKIGAGVILIGGGAAGSYWLLPHDAPYGPQELPLNDQRK
jgi:RHS repeat-associated protein